MKSEGDTIPPKVFISYSQDSDEHADRVLALADRLREDGIDASLDQYEAAPEEGWLRWMTKQIKAADFVLLVCTEVYYRRVMGEEEPGKGKGADREGLLIDEAIYDANGRIKKFIAVLLESAKETDIPDWLRPYTHHRVESDDGYEQLYRRLTHQHGTPKPELGKLKKLPARRRATGTGGQAASGTRARICPGGTAR